MELELLCGLSCDLRPQLTPVAELHLDPHLKAEMNDALDEGLPRRHRPGSGGWMSCGRRNASPRRLTGPMNDITNWFAGAL